MSKNNAKDTINLLQKLDRIYKKEMRQIQNFIKNPRWSFCENV